MNTHSRSFKQTVPSRFAAAFVLAGLAAWAPSAQAQSIAYDGFGNGPLSNLSGSNGGTGWVNAWGNASSDPTGISGTGLFYPGLATTPGGAVTPVANGGFPSSKYRRDFAVPPGATSVYVSFLLRDDAAWGSWGGVSFGQYPYEMTVGSPLGYYTYGMLTSNGLGDFASKPLIQGQTTLVVVQILKNLGAGITYQMYLDPVIGSQQPPFPAVTYGFSQVNAIPSYLTLTNGTGFTTDEIRVGATWASVLPPEPVVWTDLGFAKPGITGAPKLSGSGVLAAGQNLSLALSNAAPSAPAFLVIGTQALNLPFLGGILVPEPTFLLEQSTSATGNAGLHHLWPAGYPVGVPLVVQYWILDPTASFSVSASNGLQAISQ